MSNDTAPSDTRPAKKKRSVPGCLLSLFAGALLFVILLVVLVVWLAGSNLALKQAGDFVATKSGGKLTFADNDTNLFAGRLHWKGVELTNPSRFTDPGFVKIDELKGEVALGSVIKTGLHLSDTIEIPEVIVNLGVLSIVGADDWMKDNNALDFKNAFAPPPTEAAKNEPAKSGETPKAGKPAVETAKTHFRIAKLAIKLGKVRILKHATVAGEKPIVVADNDVNLDWELTDVSDENLMAKLRPLVIRDFTKLGGAFGNLALTLGTAMITDSVKDIAGQATDVAKNLTEKTGSLVNDGAKSLTGAIGDLLGGDKKKDEPAK